LHTQSTGRVYNPSASALIWPCPARSSFHCQKCLYRRSRLDHFKFCGIMRERHRPFSALKKEGSPILIIPPELASSHDFNGLLFIESALTFHFSVSGFAHDFTFFFFCLAFLVIAFLLLPWARFLSAISSPAAGQDLNISGRPGRLIHAARCLPCHIPAPPPSSRAPSAGLGGARLPAASQVHFAVSIAIPPACHPALIGRSRNKKKIKNY